MRGTKADPEVHAESFRHVQPAAEEHEACLRKAESAAGGAWKSSSSIT